MQPFAAAAAVRPQGYGRTLTWLPASIICDVVVALHRELATGWGSAGPIVRIR